MFKTLIILYALSFWVTECTPNPSRSFSRSPLSMCAAEKPMPAAAWHANSTSAQSWTWFESSVSLMWRFFRLGSARWPTYWTFGSLAAAASCGSPQHACRALALPATPPGQACLPAWVREERDGCHSAKQICDGALPWIWPWCRYYFQLSRNCRWT
jgi:hypothetical protein